MTKTVKIKNLSIGGNNPVAVQSMTNAAPDDVGAVITQIKELINAGCDIVRIAVPDYNAAKSIAIIKKEIDVPVVADIHFDYKLATEAIQSGADKIRINPGNIGGENNIKYVADCANEYGIPIRVGTNSGSVESGFLKADMPKYKKLAESALKSARLLERQSFYNIVLSAKSSSVKDTVAAYEYLAAVCDYPLHLGVTEAGGGQNAVIKSAIGIGSLLIKEIGDTIRVSITGNPLAEVSAAKDILKAAGLIPHVDIISCPTCGRCRYNMEEFVTAAQKLTQNVNKFYKIAVMGCTVNGPGEAKEADLGIAGGDKKMAIFKKGKIIKTVTPQYALQDFTKEIITLIEYDNNTTVK